MLSTASSITLDRKSKGVKDVDAGIQGHFAEKNCENVVNLDLYRFVFGA